MSRWPRHSLFKSVYQFLRPCMQKDLLWPIFGCKVGPDWNETRTWRVTLPTRCIYQVTSLKTCRTKARKTSKNPKRAKIIAKIPKIWLLQEMEIMSTGIQRAIFVLNLKNLSWWSFKLIFQSILKKFRKTWTDGQVQRRTDGLVDGRTGGHCHGMMRPFFKRAYVGPLTFPDSNFYGHRLR